MSHILFQHLFEYPVEILVGHFLQFLLGVAPSLQHIQEIVGLRGALDPLRSRRILVGDPVFAKRGLIYVILKVKPAADMIDAHQIPDIIHMVRQTFHRLLRFVRVDEPVRPVHSHHAAGFGQRPDHVVA